MKRKSYRGLVKRSPSYWKPKGYEHFKTIKELAVSPGIETDPSWLRKLERRGILPRPATVKRGQIHIRLYSPEDEQEIKLILYAIKQIKAE